jgi:hypothetical protein
MIADAANSSLLMDEEINDMDSLGMMDDDDTETMTTTITSLIGGTTRRQPPVLGQWSSLRHGCIVFEMLSTAGIFVAIGALTSWHMKLITAGETCVETYINRKERDRLSKMGFPFRNPFDFSARENWNNFLGFNQPGRGWMHLLLPFPSPPSGDGLTWNTNLSPERKSKG